MKEKDKPKSQKPLLYISQPSLKEPSHKMQTQYRSSTDQTGASTSRIEDTVDFGRNKTKKNNIKYFEEEEFIFEEEKVEEKEEIKQVKEENEPVSAADYFRYHDHSSHRPSKGGLNPVKSFISMTIGEKLHHLSSKPQFYSCTFSTRNSSVTGKLHAAEKENIVVKADSGELVKIEKQDLTGIRINA